MRKAIDGLCLLVQADLDANPQSGKIYGFINRTRDKIKLLYWTSNGFCLLYKRIEKGRLSCPDRHQETYAITRKDLGILLQGFPLKWRSKAAELSFQNYG
jgi:transposase